MDLTEAYRMATGLVAEHGLTGWRVELDNAKRRAGLCRQHDRVISLSLPLTRLHSEAEVRETVLHEIAHALVGAQHGHDEVWRRTAVAIGSSGERCVHADAPRVSGAWLGVCSAGHTRERHRRPERVMSCARCSEVFRPEHILEWTYRGRPAAMHPNYLAELDAILRGSGPVRLGVGTPARVTGPGRFQGRVGTVVAVGRTRYRLSIEEGVLSVIFAHVEPVRG
ncbi:MAG TPA: SprT-like domain-containing protein [Nocardioides sp.]|uniref:SprT-like domain-containing protein n=1 Tax=Nocardioides sp. TaxID=35761 RepID=UPI002C7AAAF6|nr:SprT-like domain-containing protein [Nocardioides sp.]HQR28144.1 SprT-like domain-containing protein [Nocardioides sp.]